MKLGFSATVALEFCVSEAMQIRGGAAWLRSKLFAQCQRGVKVITIRDTSEEIMRKPSTKGGYCKGR